MLSEKILAAGNLTEAYDAIMNAIGMKAWQHLEGMMIAQHVRERRSVERDFTPYSVLDIDLLKRLGIFAESLPQGSDPVKPGVRLAGLVESLEELRVKAERGW